MPSGTPIPGRPSCCRRNRSESGVRLIIADEGPGIAPEDLDHIFEQFYQGRQIPEPGYGGSGIRLSGQSFVEAQGGTITARNRKEGGAEFVVEL